jgi:hypothetical protein
MILGIVSPPPPPADAAAEAEAAFLGANMERFNALRGAPRAEDAEEEDEEWEEADTGASLHDRLRKILAESGEEEEEYEDEED